MRVGGFVRGRGECEGTKASACMSRYPVSSLALYLNRRGVCAVKVEGRAKDSACIIFEDTGLRAAIF